MVLVCVAAPIADAGTSRSARALEYALTHTASSPRPTSASCRAATRAERAAAPFGHTRLPLFTCLIVVTAERAWYAVEVLRSGCFVAERHRPGRAIYGCGARRS
jgi:hypothetical protein